MENIEWYLQALGQGRLTALLGGDVVSQANELFPSLSEARLSAMLRARHGLDVLGDKAVREALLQSLSPEAIAELAERCGIPAGSTSTKTQLERILKLRWSPDSVLPAALIGQLQLPADLLPAAYEPPPSVEVVHAGFSLFPHQRAVRTRVTDAIRRSGSHALLHLPTGAGKTRTAMESIADFVRSEPSGVVLWLAHSEELCEQAVATWKAVWERRGDSDVPVVRLWGRHTPPLTGIAQGMIVGGLQRLHSMISGSELKAALSLQTQVSLVVVDEAHRALAPTYSACIRFFMAGALRPRLLGLTATPGRSGTNNSGENEQLVEMFGGPGSLITLQDDGGNNLASPVSYLQERGFLASAVRVPLKTHIDFVPTQAELRKFRDTGDIPPSLLDRISNSNARNKLIFEELLRLSGMGKRVIVFASSVRQARLLAMLVSASGTQAHCVDAGSSAAQRARATQEFREGKARVLVNYEVFTTGFDAPGTDCVLIARPTASIVLYSQMIGRGLRGPKVGGSERCAIVDVVDNIASFPSEEWAFNYFRTYWEEKESIDG